MNLNGRSESVVELTREQQRIVDFVYEVFRHEAAWPTFQYADKVLAHEGIDLQSVLRSMPERLVFPEVTWSGWFYRPDDDLKLTIAGLSHCADASREVRYFIDTLRYIASREWNDVPSRPNEVSSLEVTSVDVMKEIGGDGADLARTHLLLSVEPSIYSVLSGRGSEWSLQPSIEIRRFRETRDVEEYLAAQAEFMPSTSSEVPQHEESRQLESLGASQTARSILWGISPTPFRQHSGQRARPRGHLGLVEPQIAIDMEKSQEPRRHHLVPKVHLRRFARDDRLFVVDLQEQKTFVSSVDKVAVEVGFYDINVEELDRAGVEKVLSQLEGGFATVMEHVDQGEWPLSAEDRRVLATFISFQHIRGRRFRDSVSGFFDELGKKILLLMANRPHLLERALRERGIELTNDQLGELVESIEGGDFSVDIEQTGHVGVMFQNAVELADMYEAFSWVLLETDSDHVELLTGDHPVVLWSDRPGPAPLYGIGIATADEITMPLDLRRALMLVPDKGGDRKRKLTNDLASSLNGRLVRAVKRFVFAHPDGLGAEIEANVRGQQSGPGRESPN